MNSSVEVVSDIWGFRVERSGVRMPHSVAYALYCVFVAEQYNGATHEEIAKHFNVGRATVSCGIKRISTILIEEHPKYYGKVCETIKALGIDKNSFIKDVVKNRRPKKVDGE